MGSGNPGARRHTLLFAAVVFLLIAGLVDPAILHRFACRAGIVTAAFLMIAAFLAAKGIRKLADISVHNEMVLNQPKLFKYVMWKNKND